MLERQTYAKTAVINTVNTAKSKDSNFIVFYLCPPMVTSRAGKKRNTILLAVDCWKSAGKLIVAVQNLTLITDPLESRLWHPVDDVLPAAPNNGTKNLQAGL